MDNSMIEHWMTTGLIGATGTFQRASREYAEDYAAVSVTAELERLCAENEALRTALAKVAQPAQPAALQNMREGKPYDNPAFESLCREHEVWGTAASALCAVFWNAAMAQPVQPAEYAEMAVAAERERWATCTANLLDAVVTCIDIKPGGAIDDWVHDARRLLRPNV